MVVVTARDLDEVRRWGLLLMGQLAAEPIPEFGSAEWVAARGPVRLASAVRAGIAWAESADPHRLAVEVEAELAAYRAAEAGDVAEWRQVARRVRAMANEPTHAELVRRRAF